MTATAWIDRWRRLLPEHEAVAHRFHQGRAFQRSGRVASMRVEPGRLSGRVQGSRPTPYQVEVLFGLLPDDDWRTAADVIAGQVRFAAGLLAGQVTADLVDALSGAGVDLFGPGIGGPTARPGSPDGLDARCACGEATPACAHLVALWEQAAQHFTDDPFALFALRGRGRQRLLAELLARRRREDEAPDRIPLHALRGAAWTRAPEPLDDDVRVPQGEGGTDPLRLLGDPPGWTGVTSAEESFRPLVDRAARRARDLEG